MSDWTPRVGDLVRVKDGLLGSGWCSDMGALTVSMVNDKTWVQWAEVEENDEVWPLFALEPIPDQSTLGAKALESHLNKETHLGAFLAAVAADARFNGLTMGELLGLFELCKVTKERTEA